jgi:PHP family Zn ribbon phosphoesterase
MASSLTILTNSDAKCYYFESIVELQSFPYLFNPDTLSYYIKLSSC